MINLSKQDFLNLSKEYETTFHESLILLSSILKRSYSELFFKNNFEISKGNLNLLKSYLLRRQKKEPIAKIIEKKEFYGINFKTTKETLDPRPETELIIDLFLYYYRNREQPIHILDLGCGTGCIGLTILKLYKNMTCDFVDISENALKIAKSNAENLKLSNRSNFIKSNWFVNIYSRYDSIVSNPPYISKSYHLDLETLYDPEVALFSENEGMSDVTYIISNAFKYIKSNGMLFIEMGFNQSKKIKSIKTKLKLIKIEKDLSNIDRVAVFKL